MPKQQANAQNEEQLAEAIVSQEPSAVTVSVAKEKVETRVFRPFEDFEAYHEDVPYSFTKGKEVTIPYGAAHQFVLCGMGMAL